MKSKFIKLCLAVFLGSMMLASVNTVKAEESAIAGDGTVQDETGLSLGVLVTVDEGELPCYDLATPKPYTGGGSEGSGRAIGFLADSDFAISSVGIMGNLINQSFDVVIYDSPDGHSAGTQLYLTSAVTGGTGFGWNDIPVSFSFTAGSYYVLNWRPSTHSDWATGVLSYFYDSELPFAIGPLTILEGMEGDNAQNVDNYLHPHLRLCVDDCDPIGLKEEAIELKQDALWFLNNSCGFTCHREAKDKLEQAIEKEKQAIEQLETCFECENEDAASGAIALINRAIGLEEHAIHALEQSRPMVRKARYNINKSIDALYEADMLLEACDQPRRPEKQRPAVRRP